MSYRTSASRAANRPFLFRYYKKVELRDRLANRVFETVEAIDAALTETLRPYWEKPEKLAQLTGYHWWVKHIPNIPTS